MDITDSVALYRFSASVSILILNSTLHAMYTFSHALLDILVVFYLCNKEGTILNAYSACLTCFLLVTGVHVCMTFQFVTLSLSLSIASFPDPV